MIPHWPLGLRQMPRRGTWAGGPKDARRVFQPDVGPPLMRAASTAEVMIYANAVFPNFSQAQRALFETFWRVDLARGALPFSWREPESNAPGLWLIGSGETGYVFNSKGAGLSDLTVTLIRKPGTPWFAPYMLAGFARVPAVVADYTGSVFGVDGKRSLAAAVALVAGTYDVYTISTAGLVTTALAAAITAGDIPASAPMDVARIVAFLP